MDQEPKGVIKMRPLTDATDKFFRERLGIQPSPLDSTAERFVFVLTGRERPVVDSDPRSQESIEQYERSVRSATNLLRDFITSHR